VTRPGRRRRADSRYAEQAGRLAEWLRDRRMQAGMSQEQLSARAQVAVATVRKIEKGVVIEPGYFTVLALMHALGAASEDPAVLGRRVSIVANFSEPAPVHAPYPLAAQTTRIVALTALTALGLSDASAHEPVHVERHAVSHDRNAA
jgi:transcriptional regulator with XRE-family HTH domain